MQRRASQHGGARFTERLWRHTLSISLSLFLFLFLSVWPCITTPVTNSFERGLRAVKRCDTACLMIAMAEKRYSMKEERQRERTRVRVRVCVYLCPERPTHCQVNTIEVERCMASPAEGATGVVRGRNSPSIALIEST
jgi:hypothetical protein